MEKTRIQRFDILRTKHWQWVLFLFAIIIPLDMVRLFVGYLLPFPWINVSLASLIGALHITYPMLMWNRLDQILSGEQLYERTNRKPVIIAAVLFMLIQMMAPIATYVPARIGMGIIFLFCFLFICSLPAKQLKSIELKRNANVWEYASDTFNFLLWPLGIFWLQGRINDIPEKRIVIKE